jgi:adenine-specific DNA-methyltransferase
MQNLYKDLIQELAKNEKFLLQGQVSASLVRDKAYKLDPELVGLLFGNEKLKQEFFTETNGAMIFNYPKFAKFITNKEFLPDSYTEFESNIGLSVGDKFLSENKEVVLSFPFKDCILEGGMDSEEAKNRKEIFYNQTLAPDDIHKLKSPKALKSWKRYTAKGEIPLLVKGLNEGKKNSPLEGWQTQSDGVDSLKLKDDGTFDENFIIKGNNLLALYSLMPRYKGKVKLIYIDPPYNTGNDGFKYNDNFNHSTWLTFMKNRLEIARELLRDDGSIWISIDDKECAYLKVLCDDIFNRDNYIGQISVAKGTTTGQDAKMLGSSIDHLLVYSKNKEGFELNGIPLSDKDLLRFNSQDERGNYSILQLRKTGSNDRREDRPNLYYSITAPNGENIYPLGPGGYESNWRVSKNRYEELVKENYIEWVARNGVYVPYVKYYAENRTKSVSNLWIDIAGNKKATITLKNLFDKENVFNNPKPVELIKKILLVGGVNNNDLIIDFHAGSGTTAHAVLELNKEDGGNRKFILVEQMDYINTVTCPRVQKVMEKENIDDSFIYLELAKNNIIFLEKIESLENGVQAWSLFEELSDSIWISYRVDIDKFKEHKDQFLALHLEDQKKVLRDIINYNHLYVNYEDMEDIAYKDCGLSTEDKALTTQFYEKKPTDQNELL